jgi:outer membrane lipoprotein-sorting protein
MGGPDTVGSEKTTRLELIPKSAEMLKYFKQIDLWISDSSGLPVQQKALAPNGDYNQATYSNMVLNPKLPDSAVTLTLPPGVKVEHPQK